MVEYDRRDISEEIYVNIAHASKECDLCHFWCYKDIGFNINHIFAMVVVV